ncbi:MAG TPA: NAD(P)/FAD-dependent oxidoreductase [Xanthobacteraceae bacterium]|nr:NAD(P)/FAD-dependent oxidoreductase [Xanthobacteraceae bacterium]
MNAPVGAHADIFVIGAGPAGLTAAYCLTKETPSVIVIEKDPVYVGGISRTVEYNGFMFDIGGHRFFSKAKEVVDLWHEILPDDFIARPRLSRIYYGGKYYSYPLSAFEALANLGLFKSAACMLSFAYAKARPIKEPANFHEWVRNQFGEKLFSIFFKTYTEKVWGMSCDAISADWAAQRIKGLDLGVAVMNALKKALLPKRAPKAGAPIVKTLIESFQYPRRGPGMMWEAAARKIQKRGAKVLKGREFTGMSYDHARKLWTIAVACQDGSSETYTANHVVSSAPVRELVEKITPTPISRLHARSLRYRDFLTVALMVKKPDLFPDNWIYIHDPAVKVGRVQNFRSWSPELVQPGMSCLGLEYFCFEGDSLWDAPDAELIALAKREIAQIGLIAEGDVVDACVVRQPKAYPVYDEDYRENVATVRRDLEGLYPTLHLVGRNGMHKYNNQDHAMMTAMLTAKNILAGERRYDIWNVNEDAEYHEAGGSGVREALASERMVPQKAKAAETGAEKSAETAAA